MNPNFDDFVVTGSKPKNFFRGSKKNHGKAGSRRNFRKGRAHGKCQNCDDKSCLRSCVSSVPQFASTTDADRCFENIDKSTKRNARSGKAPHQNVVHDSSQMEQTTLENDARCVRTCKKHKMKHHDSYKVDDHVEYWSIFDVEYNCPWGSY